MPSKNARPPRTQPYLEIGFCNCSQVKMRLYWIRTQWLASLYEKGEGHLDTETQRRHGEKGRMMMKSKVEVRQLQNKELLGPLEAEKSKEGVFSRGNMALLRP